MEQLQQAMTKASENSTALTKSIQDAHGIADPVSEILLRDILQDSVDIRNRLQDLERASKLNNPISNFKTSHHDNLRSH